MGLAQARCWVLRERTSLCCVTCEGGAAGCGVFCSVWCEPSVLLLVLVLPVGGAGAMWVVRGLVSRTGLVRTEPPVDRSRPGRPLWVCLVVGGSGGRRWVRTGHRP